MGCHPYPDATAIAAATPMAERANNLHLLRLLFAFLVLLSHAYELIDGSRENELLTRFAHTISFGDLAVDFFFALSGYLVCQSWERQPRVVSYLSKRIARIYPGFITASLVSILVVGPAASSSVPAYWAELDLASLVTGLLLLGTPDTPPIFVGSHYPEINAPLWTISYEFLCYLSLMALGLSGLLRGRRAVFGLWLLSIGAFILIRFSQLDAHPSGTPGGQVESCVRFAMLFLAGVSFFKFRFHERGGPAAPWLIAAAFFLGLNSPLLAEPVVATAGTYLILIIGFAPTARPWFRQMPDLSYGTYLYGWPVQKLLLFSLPYIAPLPLFALSLVAALVCAALSWQLIEKPGLEWTRRLRQRSHRSRANRIAPLEAP